jgi:hypothetical protein
VRLEQLAAPESRQQAFHSTAHGSVGHQGESIAVHLNP